MFKQSVQKCLIKVVPAEFAKDFKVPRAGRPKADLRTNVLVLCSFSVIILNPI